MTPEIHRISDYIQSGEIEIKTGPFGTQLKASEYTDEGIPVINVRNIGFGNIIDEKLEYISKETANRLSVHLLQSNDIIFGRKGAVERHAVVECENNGWLQGSDCIRLRVKSQRLLPRYLSYYFLTQEHKNFMKSMCSHGSTMASLNQSILEKIEFPYFNLCEQKKIVSVLWALDKKIKLNNHINQKLEEMEQAIFKSWFVDFEPFQDDEFVESDLGLIPKGWKVGTISDLGEVIGGSTPSKVKPEYYSENGISWITPKDLSIQKSKYIYRGATDITEEGLKNSSAKLMPPGSVLFSSRAPIGYIAIAGCQLCTNQGFKSVVPYSTISTAYAYYFLKENRSIIERMASGSTFKEVSGSTMKSVPAVIPDEAILTKFNHVCAPLFSKQKTLEQENIRLADARDTLLPKLMSGIISIPVKVD